MNLYYLDLKFVARGYENEDQLEEHTECILDELMELDDVIDPDLTVRLSTGDLIFSVGVEADNEPRALSTALARIRAAIHAADGCTPGWEARFQEIEQTIRAAEDNEGDLIEA